MSVKDIEERYLDQLIKLAFDLDDLQKAQQIIMMANRETDLPDEETISRIWQLAQDELNRLEKDTLSEKRRKRIKQFVPQFMKIAACILIIFSLAVPVVIASSAEFRSKVIEMLINIDHDNNVAYFDFIENGDASFAVPEGWIGDYYISYIPEGMEVCRYSAENLYIEYADTSETTSSSRGFSFMECNEGDGVAAKTDDAIFSIIDVNGYTACMIEHESTDEANYVGLTWSNEEKMFDLSCYDMDVNEVMAIARSVRKVIK